MEKKKKKLVVLSIILLLIICAVVIALLCIGKGAEPSTPEQTEPDFFDNSTTPPTSGTSGSTTPPTVASTIPTDPTGTIDPLTPTDPTGTADPSPTETVDPSAPTQTPVSTDPTVQPGNPESTQPTSRPTNPATQPATQNSKPTQPTQPTQPTTPQETQPFTYHTKNNTYLSVGEILPLDYTYVGDKAKLTWSSSDPTVLTVNKGVVTAVGAGGATVRATDGDKIWRISLNVLRPEDRTVSIDLQIDCPLYDGVTKFVGHYLQINTLHSYCRNSNGDNNNYVDEWKASGTQTNPSKPTSGNHTRNYYITSSNPDVVSVANKFDCGFYDDFLYFNKAGTSVITVTSWDGYSQSYTIHVKGDYDCAPGKTKLTPGEFAYYATMVGVEDGLEASYHIRSYLYIWYDEDELTWEEAKSLGHINAKREFFLNSDTTIIVYAGFDESNGKHLFYHGSGEPDGKLAPYTPAKASTGKIRFPSKSIDIMEKTLKVVEVLGDTRDEFVVYTSSDPSIVEASGSMLIAKRPGTATITATYKGQTATMTVNVTMDPTIERIIFEQDTYTVALNDTITLNYTYNGTSKLKWESWDESVARIDIMGTLVPVSEGECTIRLSSVDDDFVAGYCTVIVTPPIDYPDATDILFRDTADALYDGMVLRVGDVLILDPYTIPADSWTDVWVDSSDNNAVSVNFGWDENQERNVYYLLCQESGTVTITLTSSDECVTKSYSITVKDR